VCERVCVLMLVRICALMIIKLRHEHADARQSTHVY
jgi:hypothetical protein